MRPFLLLAGFFLFNLSVPLHLSGQTPKSLSAASPLELQISGPRLIHRGQTLKFNVTLTNRSDKPVAFRFPFEFDDETRFAWRITDTGGRLLPPPVYTGPPIFVCPVTGPVTDSAITVLQPGEKMEYPNAGDPSDQFAFPGKGFYRVTLTYVLVPTSYIEVARFRPPDKKPGRYTPQQKIEMLKAQPRFEAVSNVWQFYLAD